MNTYNHHRIIEQFTSKVRQIQPDVLKDEHVNVLMDASDFTDDFLKAEWKYFLYHFYYDMRVENDTVVFDRVDEETNKSADSMKNCDTKNLNHWFNEKEFFATINDRPKSPKCNPYDASNQSDNVAFLHAMGGGG